VSDLIQQNDQPELTGESGEQAGESPTVPGADAPGEAPAAGEPSAATVSEPEPEPEPEADEAAAVETVQTETVQAETVQVEPVQSETAQVETAPVADADTAAGGEAVSEENAPAAGEQTMIAEPHDPFAAWPQAASAEVVEAAPEVGALVEHVAGEIDVPDGYSVLEGTPTGHRRSVAVVVARFNGGLTNRMLASAIGALEEAGVAQDSVTIVPVPGAFELPLTAMALAKTRRYACVVALGVIVRGETPHFDYIASEAASGLQLAAIETGVPVAFGVLTVETVEQAEARVDRAAEAVRTALEMADVFAQLRASARQS